MTLQGAIKQLHELRSAEDMPIYYKPAIDKVIETFQMDAQEVRHGWWVETLLGWRCSVCGEEQDYSVYFKHCPNCGARMDEVEENER